MPTGVAKEIDLVRDINLTVVSPLTLSAENSDGMREISGPAAGATDHGALTGLSDIADHPYAALIDGTRNFTGTQLFEAPIQFINTDTQISGVGGSLAYSVAAGEIHTFRIDSVSEMFLSANSMTFPQGINSVALDWATDNKIGLVFSGTTAIHFSSTEVLPVLDAAMSLGDVTLSFNHGWFAGSVHSNRLFSTVPTGTKPVTVTSTTMCDGLNADQVDGLDSTDLLLVDGSQALSADWDAGSFDIRAAGLRVDTDAGGVAGTTTFVNTYVAPPGLGTVAIIGNIPAGYGAAQETWLKFYREGVEYILSAWKKT